MAAIRLGICLIVILGMVYNVVPNSIKEVTMNPGECMRDQSFIMTDGINQWLVDNPDWRKKYMIYAGFLMDMTFLVALLCFFVKFQTYRLVCAFIVFMLTRAFVQNVFLMSRPAGFAWFNPGMPALTVPYHDTNDFYFSGHVGSSTILTLEFFLNGYPVLGLAALFVLVNQWVLLMLVRTHYIIDRVTGLLLAHWAMMNAEVLSYLIDVKVLGWTKKQRKLAFHDVCASCGWANSSVALRIDANEKEFLQKTHRLHDQMRLLGGGV